MATVREGNRRGEEKREMSSLPPLSATQGLTTIESTQFSPLTFRPVATKAEKYAKLMKIDHQELQRPTAHFRNALKTTGGLERVARQLKEVSSMKENSQV